MVNPGLDLILHAKRTSVNPALCVVQRQKEHVSKHHFRALPQLDEQWFTLSGFPQLEKNAKSFNMFLMLKDCQGTNNRTTIS